MKLPNKCPVCAMTEHDNCTVMKADGVTKDMENSHAFEKTLKVGQRDTTDILKLTPIHLPGAGIIRVVVCECCGCVYAKEVGQ